jgi:hypothetical protein
MTDTPPHPFAPKFEFAFTVGITLAKPKIVRPSTMGAERWGVWAADGYVEGPDVKGIVVPMSGGDFPLLRPNGVIDFDARYFFEMDDGSIIYLQSRGYRWPRTAEIGEKMARNEDVGPDDYYMRVVPKFDAPEGKYAWMGQYVFVGVAEKIPGANRIHYFKVM